MGRGRASRRPVAAWDAPHGRRTQGNAAQIKEPARPRTHYFCGGFAPVYYWQGCLSPCATTAQPVGSVACQQEQKACQAAQGLQSAVARLPKKWNRERRQCASSSAATACAGQRHAPPTRGATKAEEKALRPRCIHTRRLRRGHARRSTTTRRSTPVMFRRRSCLRRRRRIKHQSMWWSAS